MGRNGGKSRVGSYGSPWVMLCHTGPSPAPTSQSVFEPKSYMTNNSKTKKGLFFFCSCVCFKLQKFLKGKFIGFRCYFRGFCNSRKTRLHCLAKAWAAAGPILPVGLGPFLPGSPSACAGRLSHLMTHTVGRRPSPVCTQGP